MEPLQRKCSSHWLHVGRCSLIPGYAAIPPLVRIWLSSIVIIQGDFFCFVFFSFFEDVFDTVQLDWIPVGWHFRQRAQSGASACGVIIVDYAVEVGVLYIIICLLGQYAGYLHQARNNGNNGGLHIVVHFLYRLLYRNVIYVQILPVHPNQIHIPLNPYLQICLFLSLRKQDPSPSISQNSQFQPIWKGHIMHEVPQTNKLFTTISMKPSFMKNCPNPICFCRMVRNPELKNSHEILCIHEAVQFQLLKQNLAIYFKKECPFLLRNCPSNNIYLIFI